MTLYRPDYKMQEAKELIDNLDDSKDNELIKYYVKKKEELIKKKVDKLREYQDWFDKLDLFLPNKNIKF